MNSQKLFTNPRKGIETSVYLFRHTPHGHYGLKELIIVRGLKLKNGIRTSFNVYCLRDTNPRKGIETILGQAAPAH